MSTSQDSAVSGKNNSKQFHESFAKAFDEVQDYAFVLLDPGGNIENWNQGAQKIKGYEPEEIIGKNFEIFYPEKDRKEKLPQHLLKIARDQGRAIHEGWRIRKNGNPFWGYIVITALHDANGKVTGFLKVTRDLTEQKEATEKLKKLADQLVQQNEQLRQSEERYHRMVEEVQDYSIILLDINGVIQNWNKGATKIKGYQPEEIIGKNFSIFYGEDDLKKNIPQKLLDTARQNEKSNHEGWRIRKDGTRFWGSTVITALHNEQHQIIGFSKVTRDLSDKKQVEEQLRAYAEQLEQNNHELEQFAYVASHDLKEPLRKIMTFGDLLVTNSGQHLDDRGKEYVTRMQNAAVRMMNLIEDLLNFSRVNRQSEGYERIDLSDVIKQVMQDLDEQIKEKNAVINVSDLVFINGRRSEIGQLFQNLISNAIKFNDKPFPIININCQIKNSEDIQHVQIDVQDNGIGFEDIYNKKIFDIFQRLHGKSAFAGSGIGLAICKKVVESHGGKIFAHGELGVGATFTIKLPLI